MRALPLFCLLALGACNEAQAPPPAASDPQPLTLIRQKESPDRAELQALGGGMLSEVNGCVRIGEPDNSRLLIWPPNVTEKDGAFHDPTTGTSVYIAEPLVIGGGEIDGVDPAGLDAPMPSECAGPYWLGASGFFPAPKKEWRTVRIAERYSIKLFPEAAGSNPQPSALPASFAGRGLTLTITEGADACSLPDAGADQAWTYNVYTDQRIAQVLRRKPPAGQEMLDAVFRGVDGPRGVTPPSGEICLNLHAVCATARACDYMRTSLSTIRFGDLGRPD